MKSFVVALCVFAVAAAVSDKDAQVVGHNYEQGPDGSFSAGFQSDNGISANSVGELRKDAKGEAFLAISGSNEFQTPDGETRRLTYVADENGYQPQADYLPTPPAPEPIPEYILRAIQWAAEHPYTEAKKL